MKLLVFEKNNRTCVDMIRTYDYVYYEEQFRGRGSFEIRIPTSETSLIWLVKRNFILFDDGVLGIIKRISDSQDDETQITISGYLSNHILEYRSFLLTTKIYDTIGNAIRSMFNGLFVNPDDENRKISFLKLSEDEKYIPKLTTKDTFQNTGKTFLDYTTDLFSTYDLGYKLYPVIVNFDETTGENANIRNMEYQILTPVNRAYNNSDGNIPVVFSFDLDNLQSIEYEEDLTDYCTVAIVASEGTGGDRKMVEVQQLENGNAMTGYERMELYVDARDLQSEPVGEDEEPLTDEELEALMVQRGKEKLEDHQIFTTFNGTILEGKYKYGVDFNLGDYVSVIDKRTNKVFDVQIYSIRKTYSNGVEHLDIQFGKDRLNVRELKERRLYNV